MRRFQYVIVGGGMTAAAAVKGVHEVDPRGAIALIAAEPHPTTIAAFARRRTPSAAAR
jgi:hypothetical protein